MLNLPQQLAPLHWGEYFGHTKEQHIILQAISGGSATLPNNMFIHGVTGTGKTTFINLIIRSLYCSNPQDYQLEDRLYRRVNPCGECEFCVKLTDFRKHSGEHTNITHIQSGASETETLNAQVKRSLELARKPPVNNSNGREDLRFIIYDEWQLFSKPLRQQVLLKAEEDGYPVIFFFITMSEEELPLDDKIAMMSRGCPIELRGFPPEDIARYLLQTINQIPAAPRLKEPEAKQIALRSSNSIRMALAHYERVVLYDWGLPEVRPSTVRYFLNYTEPEQRKDLWQVILNSNFVELDETISRVTTLYSATKLNDLGHDLISDITSAMKQGRGNKEHQLLALRMLYQYVANYKDLRITDYLIQLTGLNLGTTV